MNNFQPIGIFDSGYGGLTVLDKITQEMPQYDFIYLGDNARTPYGTRSFAVVYELTRKAVFKLFDLGCNLVILACNTASAKALRTIQQNDIPKLAPDKRVLGVIRPCTEIINKFSSSKHIGILGTEGTVNSLSYIIEIQKFFPYITATQEACPMWVPLVENNEAESPGADYFIEKHINNLLSKDKNIDAIILGCTHYPLLLNKIKKYTPSNIKIIAQGNIVSNSLINYLNRHPEIDRKCSKSGIRKFYTSESPKLFEKRAGIFLKANVGAEHIVI